MENIKGYSKLAEPLQKLFRITYKKHIASMGKDEKEKHALENIKQIKVNKSDKCLDVYFKHEEWYKYYTNYTWG